MLQQEQGEVIEAASLRVAPLEEQRQAAVQAVLAQTKATRRQASMRQASPGQTPATAAGTAEEASVIQGVTTSRGSTACPPTPAAEVALHSETPGRINAPGNPAAEALPTGLAVPPPNRSRPAATAESLAGVAAARPGKTESGPSLSAVSEGSPGAGASMSTTSAASEDTAMADASSSLPAVAAATAAADAAVAMDAAQSAATAANGQAGASCDVATAAQTGPTAAQTDLTAAQTAPTAAQTAPTAAPEGTTGPTDGSTATAAGRGTGQSSIPSPAVHSGARVAAAAQEHAKAHAEAQKKAEAEVQIKWQEGLEEAAKVVLVAHSDTQVEYSRFLLCCICHATLMASNVRSVVLLLANAVCSIH